MAGGIINAIHSFRWSIVMALMRISKTCRTEPARQWKRSLKIRTVHRRIFLARDRFCFKKLNCTGYRFEGSKCLMRQRRRV